MSDFKLGDNVWAINQFCGGNYYPSFCEYTIVGLADVGTAFEWAVLEYNSEHIANIYIKFCFHTKQEAIDAMIAHIKTP